jgi:hypothetical protein
MAAGPCLRDGRRKRSPRPGDKLFFGDTAAAVFKKSPASLLFLSS